MRIGSETVAEIVSVQDQQEPGLGFRVDGTIPKVGGGLDPLIVRKNQRVGAIYSQSTKVTSFCQTSESLQLLLSESRHRFGLTRRRCSTLAVDVDGANKNNTEDVEEVEDLWSKTSERRLR